jgi:hypothetical protein
MSTQQIIEAWENGVEPTGASEMVSTGYTLDQTEATCWFYDQLQHRWWEEHASTNKEVKERMSGARE